MLIGNPHKLEQRFPENMLMLLGYACASHMTSRLEVNKPVELTSIQHSDLADLSLLFTTRKIV